MVMRTMGVLSVSLAVVAFGMPLGSADVVDDVLDWIYSESEDDCQVRGSAFDTLFVQINGVAVDTLPDSRRFWDIQYAPLSEDSVTTGCDFGNPTSSTCKAKFDSDLIFTTGTEIITRTYRRAADQPGKEDLGGFYNQHAVTWTGMDGSPASVLGDCTASHIVFHGVWLGQDFKLHS